MPCKMNWKCYCTSTNKNNTSKIIFFSEEGSIQNVSYVPFEYLIWNLTSHIGLNNNLF